MIITRIYILLRTAGTSFITTMAMALSPMLRKKPAWEAAAGRRVPHGLISMGMDSLIWSCCGISNGILTTSGAENTKKDTEPIAIQISSNRFLRLCITTTETELLRKLLQNSDSRGQERVWDWQSRTMIATDISICL